MCQLCEHMLIMYLVRKTHEQQPFNFGYVICVSMPKMGVTAKGLILFLTLHLNLLCLL